MRSRKGAARHKAQKRLFKKAKGNWGGRNNLIRSVKETILRGEAYAYRDRRNRKREFRALWIVRINAACRERGLRYSEFIHGLELAKIEMDRRTLAELAARDPAAFDGIFAAVKEALASAAPAPVQA